MSRISLEKDLKSRVFDPLWAVRLGKTVVVSFLISERV